MQKVIGKWIDTENDCRCHPRYLCKQSDPQYLNADVSIW